MSTLTLSRWLACVLLGAFSLVPAPAAALEELCDPAFQDCRAKLLTLIRNERVGIDVAFWFMEDARYTYELIKRHQAGVQVRVLVDPRAPSTSNTDRLRELAAAGIPMRKRTASGILHWKMMLFDGQNTIQFSGANYSPWAFAPVTPYTNYTDEAIYFTNDPSVVNSFRTKYDSLWVSTIGYADYANITALTRRYGTFAKDPELNYPPLESFRSRSVKHYDAETRAIDVIMFRITDGAHAEAMIRAVKRGVPVRLITDPHQYRDPARYWHAWNVDRMYMAGVQTRMSAHQGVNHQKSVLLKSQLLTIFGSSNWTSPSSDSQEEHNYFTRKTYFLNWFTDQFERKWNNSTGFAETKAFVPLPPDKPQYAGGPANLATGVLTTGITLKWLGGFWAHNYDIYLGTTPTPALLLANAALGPSRSSSDVKQFTLPVLQPGTTYYWRIVSKTMAEKTAAGPILSFTTAGAAPPPSASGTIGPADIVLYAGVAALPAGTARVIGDATAAGGVRLAFPNAGAVKIAAPIAAPANYFEMSFNATAGTDYRLWIRGKAEANTYPNDSVYVQFSDSVTSAGAATWRIGTTSGTTVNIEECSGCGLSGWGWQDNGYGTGVLGPVVRFATTGRHTIRVQTREDGLSIDQIVLSPSIYLWSSPGALKNDVLILPAQGGL